MSTFTKYDYLYFHKILYGRFSRFAARISIINADLVISMS